MNDSGQSVSSPIATGGSGTFFEQHVGVQFLALLLVRGIPPLLKDCQVEEVHFQTENLGWSTDDLLVIGNRGDGQRRKLAAQVKRNFTISSNDETCRKAFFDFWQDFNDQGKFDPKTDRLALITLRGTTTLLDKFGSLLDCARASIDGSDFARRLSVEGLLSKKAREQATAVETILEEASGRSISSDELWRFLCPLHVISLDLNTQTAQQEASTKTLLAQTSDEPDPIAAAESTWGELLQIVGGADGMPAAGSYKYEDLPEILRRRHAALTPRPGGHLEQLVGHSSVTLDGISSTIADSVKVRREGLEAQVLASLAATQVTVISGAAGYGKSAVAKNIIEQIKEDYFCLAFRAEEFAASHIDQAVTAIQSSLTARRLLSLLSSQGRKIILVESMERLLESSERKAFRDLLRLARNDRSLRLMLTCRDYSLYTVKISLLEQVALSYEVIDVSPFTDDELDQVAQEIPGIATAIQNPMLRKLLRSPYLLNTAARIKWSDEEKLPDSEQEFRARCWSEVIRSDVDASRGMPIKREHVFVQLALRRAKELRPYVRCDDLNPDVLEALCKDSLLSFSRESRSLAAPAHDVLEDWAIIHWLKSQFAIHEGDPVPFSDDIGGYPALRRGYRTWLGEMLARDIEKADTFILAAFKDGTLPAHFQDDTIICVLLSSSAENFLFRNRNALLEHDRRLLVRVVHLLRVACKAAPTWLSGARGLTSQLLIPAGTAWAPVLKIVSDELKSLLPDHFGVVLGLVEDWSRQVTYLDPSPAGYEDAGKVVVRLLDDLNGYNSKDLRRRALEIFAKIPKSVPEAFREIIRRAASENGHDGVASDFAELLLTESICAFACRDFPKEVVELSTSFFCLTDEHVEKALRREYRYGSSFKIGPHFGIRQNVEYKFSVPASAIRGPFWFLLRSHPRHGIDFITMLMNHACSWYGEQKWPFDPLEPAGRINLSIPGANTPVTQWANGRLYFMYRGACVAPYALQSALMALEHWLLNIAEFENVNLESWLLKLLRESNNVAVTAVVASVCIANPEKCGRAGLALLSSRDVVNLDRSRMVHDQTNTNIPSLQPKHRIYDEERIESNALPHRKSHLESLAIKLQLSDKREEVWQIIDHHRDNLPPLEAQSEADRLWRLALHRMDVRDLELGEEVPVSEVKKVSSDSEKEEGHRYFTLVPRAIEPDVQEIVDRNAEQFSQQTDDLSLWNWGYSAWDRKLDADSMSWQEMLNRAKARDSNRGDTTENAHSLFEFTQGGVGYIASVCVRDHWDEMDLANRSWCINRLVEEIKRFEGSDDLAVLQGSGSMFPDRSAAYALPRAIRDLSVDEVDEGIIAAIAKALTHPVLEVRESAAEGLGYYLGETQPDFVMRCVGALAKQARLTVEFTEMQKAKPYGEQLRGRELVQSVVPEVRQDIVSGNVDIEHELENLVAHKTPGRSVVRLILQILGYLTKSKISKKLHEQASLFVTQDWAKERQNRYDSRQHDIEFKFWCSKRIARYTLKLEPEDAIEIYLPVLQVIEDYPEEVAHFVEDLIYEEDGLEQETSFWDIWQAFADRFAGVGWIDELDGNYGPASDGRKLLNALLFGIRWKDDVRSWSRLKNQESRVDALVQSIPASSAALKSYCQFLYHIGEKSLPESFTVIADRLEAGDSFQYLTESSTVYYLESLLRRFVYGEPLQLKMIPRVREAVMYLLDQLVDAGSSAAYQMRDDFVTPISPSATA